MGLRMGSYFFFLGFSAWKLTGQALIENQELRTPGAPFRE